MQKFYLLIFLVTGSFYGIAQTTLAQWNFNSTFTIPANGTAPAQSSGVSAGSTIVLTGGVTATNANGNISVDGPTPGNQALNTTTYPAQSSNPKTAGIQINVNTAGYNSVRVKFYVQHSATGAKKLVVQYFNGTTWQDITSYTYLATNTNFSTQQDVDLSAFAAVNDNVAAQIRIVTDFSIPTNYEGATGAYGTTGTIRYDLITVTGNPNSCIGPATVQASGFRLLRSSTSSAQLTLNRGNGMGCLVVCSQTGIPSAPANGSNYIANASFGTGNAVGNGFAVFNTWSSNLAINYFNITNLVAGTKYYVAAYEYSSGSFCYLGPGYVDSFICNSTVLYPGDVQIVGYDNGVASGGRDAFVLTNLKPINKGTSFQIVNSRFEAGAPANTRTNRWYAGGNSIYADLQSINLLYTGTSQLISGSIISFDFEAPTGLNIKINGLPTTDFSITSENVLNGISMLSTTGAEQFYLTQGKFTAYGISGTNQYSLLDGHVLHGISYINFWIGFNQQPSTGTNPGDRQSRLPPDIKCINAFFNTGGYAYYQPTSPHIGSQGLLIPEINNSTRWAYGAGLSGVNDIPTTVLTTPFVPNFSAPAGTWTGSSDYNWFNCNNWEGRFVPDSTTDVVINSISSNPELDGSGGFEYNNRAMARALNMPAGSIYMNGGGADRLFIYDSLLIGSTASFTTTNSGADSVVARGNIQCNTPANVGLASNVRLHLEGNRLLQPINVSLASTTPLDVYSLTINNGPGVQILTGGFQSLQQLQLLDGIMTFANSNAFHYLGTDCGIVSPFNSFAESNRGWEKSFIDGKVYVRTNSANPYTAPVGSAAKNIFAPMVFQPDNSNSRLYVVTYTASSHPNVAPADVATPPLDRVSKGEYWSLTSADANAAAKITLYYTPYSRIGGGGNDAQALNDLRIAQYWDSMATGGIKWRLYGSGGTYTTNGNVLFGRISYNQFATDLRDISKNFTIGSISPLNILPIQLLQWAALPQGKQVQLNWKVADESLVRFYTVEKSGDGVHFTSLQIVYKAGTGNTYSVYDNAPATGWNYYRLKAVGTDGKVFYSEIQKVWSNSRPAFTVYPNPVSSQLWVQLPVAGTVTLYTVEGKVVLQRSLPASLHTLNVKALPRGMYIVEYFDGRKKQSEKISFQ